MRIFLLTIVLCMPLLAEAQKIVPPVPTIPPERSQPPLDEKSKKEIEKELQLYLAKVEIMESVRPQDVQCIQQQGCYIEKRYLTGELEPNDGKKQSITEITPDAPKVYLSKEFKRAGKPVLYISKKHRPQFNTTIITLKNPVRIKVLLETIKLIETVPQ